MTNKFTFVYLKDEDGFIDEYELTNIDTKPYGEDIPIYSAFISYRALDAEDKEYIDRLSKDRKLNDEEICTENAEKTKAYIDKRVEIIKEVATNSFRAERKEIYKFIDTLKRLVDTFVKTLL